MRRLVWFTALAYLFSWIWWIPLAVSGTVVEPGQGWPTHLPGLLGPALAAVTVTAVGDGRAGLVDLWARIVRWRVGWVWYVIVAGTAALAFLPLVAGSAVPADLTVYSGAPVAGLAVLVYVLLINGFGEEIGWRGFLADHLLDRMSRGSTALVVWVVWGCWHLPLFWIVGNFRDLGIGGTIGWIVGIGCGSVLLTWMYQSAGRSILIVALWHTAFNFATATRASAGVAAAVASTAVIVASVAILLLPSSWRAPDGAVSASTP
jgi:uncharacterized protein